MAYWNDSMLMGGTLAESLNPEDVFNTSLWMGGLGKTFVETGIDSDHGSLVWVKNRSVVSHHFLVDTERGATKVLNSNLYESETTNANTVNGFGSYFFEIGSAFGADFEDYVSWQFRRAPKFFDIVTYTGDDEFGRALPHILETEPGLVLIKSLTGFEVPWIVYHRSLGVEEFGALNSSGAFTGGGLFGDTDPTSSDFFVSYGYRTNGFGANYVAYLFAHDPSPEGIIQCGSYVGMGFMGNPVVNLGWRPQYLMIKSATSTGDWQIFDTSRGFTETTDAILHANTSAAEISSNFVNPTSTGFQIASFAANVNASDETFIYMAIRAPTE